MLHFVYILECSNSRYYTGITWSIEKRLTEHNSGLSKYTKYTGPFELVYKEEHGSRAEAYRREMFLKTGRGRDFLKDILIMRE